MSHIQDFVATHLWTESIDPAVEFELKTQVDSRLKACDYEMHEDLSLFKALAASQYCKAQEKFEAKYKTLWAISGTIRAPSMIELGVLCGAAADAFLHANPTMYYEGIDDFVLRDEDIGLDDPSAYAKPKDWDGYAWTKRLLTELRCYSNVALKKANLRELSELCPTHFVSVDAAHDFSNQRRDLELAISATPRYIYVDDYDGTAGEKAATQHFIHKYSSSLSAAVPFEHKGGGVLLVLKPFEREPLLAQQLREKSLEHQLAGVWNYERVG